MKLELIRKILKQMDQVDLMTRFNNMCGKSTNTDDLMRFLQYAISQYELEKKSCLAKILNHTAYALADQIMEDPLDRSLYSHFVEINNIAKHLKIEIHAT